jgi:hypothetical protein
MDRPQDVPAASSDDLAPRTAEGELPATAALERAARVWRRRGYQVLYQDTYLVQLTKLAPSRWALLMAGLALAVYALAALRRPRWVVITLSASPDGRIVTLRQVGRRPPGP